MKRTLALLMAGLLTGQLVACGTIIYPDRRGQPAGRIDPAIAVLDGVGLLFFLIPGVIAFGVDFATGAIYLPGGKTASAQAYPLPGKGNQIGKAMLEHAIVEHTGRNIRLAEQQILAWRMSSRPALLAVLSDVNCSGRAFCCTGDCY